MIRDLRLWLLLASLVLTALPARGQETDPPLPDRNPARVAQPATEKAASVPDEKPDLPGDQPTVPWSDPKVAAAHAACTKMLEGVALDYEPLDPIKEGACGTPAPILVKSIGADPAVVISPPATITCALAVAVHAWMTEKVQPAAELLGSQVVKVRNASSYKCRNRYGGANTPISEHALANALDISEFIFASGQRIELLGNWPYSAGASALPLAPSPPLPNPHRAAASAVEEATASSETTGAIVPVSTRSSVKSTIVSLAKAKTNPFVRPPSRPVAQTLSPVSQDRGTERVNSPIAAAKSNPFVSPLPPAGVAPSAQVEADEDAAPQSETPAASPRPRTLQQEEAGAFLRAVHADACKTFETVLGPDANAAHKDHFHLDMKKRRYVKICDTAVRTGN